MSQFHRKGNRLATCSQLAAEALHRITFEFFAAPCFNGAKLWLKVVCQMELAVLILVLFLIGASIPAQHNIPHIR